MTRKKKDKQIFEYGSLHNAAVRLYAPRQYYRIKNNGDIEMLTKVSISSRIRIRLTE